uniref:Uncharacterized protein n=1 Tax=Anguilla anguilla TaxID=7936 RepID=A0A0E9UVP0_ANGAN
MACPYYKTTLGNVIMQSLAL